VGRSVERGYSKRSHTPGKQKLVKPKKRENITKFKKEMASKTLSHEATPLACPSPLYAVLLTSSQSSPRFLGKN